MPAIRALVALFLLALALWGDQGLAAVRTISPQQADTLARRQVWYRDRVVPLHTVACDVTVKLTGRRKVGQLEPTRFLASLILYPEDWTDYPLLPVPPGALADSLGLKNGRRLPLSRLFTVDGQYRLRNMYADDGSPLDKEILDLDAKVEVLLALRDNTLFSSLQEAGRQPLPSWKIELEIFYNRLNGVGWLFIVGFAATLLAAGLVLAKRKGAAKWAALPPAVIAAALFAMRWIIGGHIPLAGGEQVMLFTAALLFLFPLLIPSTRAWIGVGSLAMGSFAALVARLSASDPVVTSLSPALASPWLAFHVTVIMASYAVFALMLPVSVAMLVARADKSRAFSKPVYVMNVIGVALLAVGIVLGSLWAAEAWGSYWSWDPKENWAAVTLIIYSVPLLFRRRLINRPRLYGTLLLIAFSMVIVTYYGVNYMASLHAYARP